MEHLLLSKHSYQDHGSHDSKPVTTLDSWKAAYLKLWQSKAGTNSKKQRPSKQPLRRTAYLDGLRGFAALLVYSLHHQNWARTDWVERGIMENAWGWERHYYLGTFPGIRIIFSGGHTAVAVFFIISGYVLSVKPLSLIQAGSGESAALARNLGSALFRRWVRLYVPVMVVTFLWMTSWHVLGIQSSHPDALTPERTYRDEVWRWYCDFKNYSFIFSDNTNHYNDHAWSIPMEFRGSIVVWTSLLALAECETTTRLLVEAGLVYYFIYIVDGWYCALFMMGVLLCDIDLLGLSGQAPKMFQRKIGKWFWWLVFFVALYLGGVPSISGEISHLKTEPGWYYLAFLKPQAMWDFRWFFRFWAAFFFMISIPRLPVKKFFESSFCQYLGKISFALYLVHGPMLWTVGDRVYAATGRPQMSSMKMAPDWINLFQFPSWGPKFLEVNYLAAHFILLPLTLGIAELVTNLIDEPSVRFAQWTLALARRQASAPSDTKWRPQRSD
ncbi:hypothetical protein DOTSEDRAFT_140096 [Dothistroma septosporum NZE10]|uniref:Acyltransferase 3 domain-containing protein n=1 Tax=Dothistroma septosporum (strain NZE10 / CBS 128990) TaxID=675120 RepID=M2WIC3_DOTSN|nr:hypothetical protein DOTSEDRAFT_140096 [Dothistroma septosporum NZE10]